MPQFPNKGHRIWAVLMLIFGVFLLLPLAVIVVATILSRFGDTGKLLAILFMGAVLARWIYNLTKKEPS